MNQHPYLISQLASERQREMLVRAEQQRLARQVTAFRRASRRAERTERRIRRAAGRALPLRTELGH
jgi:hypothetical protein